MIDYGMGKYKIFVRYISQDIIRGYYDSLDAAEEAYKQIGWRYARQGYGVWMGLDGTEYGEDYEEKSDTEWVRYMTRVPFYGSGGDALTGEVTHEGTGMVDMIEIHMELGCKQPIQPFGIPMPKRIIRK